MTIDNPPRDVAEEAARWIEATGYTGDLSALTAGVHDISESIERIVAALLPRLAALPLQRGDQALEVIVDLGFEFEHIARHAEATGLVIRAVQDYADLSEVSQEKHRADKLSDALKVGPFWMLPVSSGGC